MQKNMKGAAMQLEYQCGTLNGAQSIDTRCLVRKNIEIGD